MAKRNKSVGKAQTATEVQVEVGGPSNEFAEMAGQPELEGGVATTPQAGTQEAEVAASTPAAGTQVPTLHVKQGLALRGGRGEWYKLLCKYDGKPVSEYIAAGKANPASHYTARSTKCGQPKTPESRLSWFKRAGIVTIS